MPLKARAQSTTDTNGGRPACRAAGRPARAPKRGSAPTPVAVESGPSWVPAGALALAAGGGVSRSAMML